MLLISEEYPNPPTPTPLQPNRGGPVGGGGGGPEWGVTPKCDMFLEIPWKDQAENLGKVGNVGIVGKVG